MWNQSLQGLQGLPKVKNLLNNGRVSESRLFYLCQWRTDRLRSEIPCRGGCSEGPSGHASGAPGEGYPAGEDSKDWWLSGDTVSAGVLLLRKPQEVSQRMRDGERAERHCEAGPYQEETEHERT